MTNGSALGLCCGRAYAQQHSQRQYANHDTQRNTDRDFVDVDKTHLGSNEHQDHCQAVIEQMEFVGYGSEQEIHGTQAGGQTMEKGIQAKEQQGKGQTDMAAKKMDTTFGEGKAVADATQQEFSQVMEIAKMGMMG